MIFKEKLGVRSVRLALTVLAGSAFIAGNAHAQAQVATAAAPQKVEITGSNIKRADKEGTSPIQVISVKDIRESGAKTVLELLKLVPALGADGFNDVSNQNGFSRGVATASLRSLGSTSTLILLNGRRLTPSAYANPNNGTSTLYDLNTIPISAVERVEIFKDGASAVYGSDAIGGVINFITKKDYQGFEVAVRAGGNDDYEFARQNVNASAGFGNLNSDGYNVFVAGDYTRRERSFIRDTTDDVEQDLYGNINFRLNPFSSFASDQPFFFRERTANSRAFLTGATAVNRLNCDPSRQIVGAPVHNITAGTLLGRRFCNFNLNDYSESQNKGTDTSVLAIGTLRVTDKIEAFGEFAYAQSERTTNFAPSTIDGRTPVTNFLLGGVAAPFQAILPIGHPDNPYTDARAAAVYRFENIQNRNDLTNRNTRLLGGFKGETLGLSWETGFLWNQSARDDRRVGLLNLPTLRTLLSQNRSLASLAADPTITVPLTNKAIAAIKQLDGKVAGEFWNLPGGAIGFAAGGEYRREKLVIDPDPANARGDVLGLANTAIDATRNVYSGFLEFRLPFLKNWEVDVAGRADKYPGIKTSYVPKVGTKWTVTDSVALRASYSEGFRAPAVSQTAPGGAQFFQTVTDPIRCPDGVTPVPGADQVDCARGISGVGTNNPDLRPETSKSYTAGLIISPSSKFDISIDYYKIRKELEVALSSTDLVLNNPDRFPGAITRDTNPVNFITDAQGRVIPNSGPLIAVSIPWTNQGSTETSGVDLSLKFLNSLGTLGQLQTTFNGTYVLSYRRAETPGDREANVVGTNGGLSDFATSSPSVPRVRARLSTSWTKESHTAYASINYVSQISLLRRTDNDVTYPVPYCHYGSGQPASARSLGGLPAYSTYFNNCAISSWTTVDAGYTYSGIKNLTLGINVLNIFDTKAPYAPASAVLGYDAGLHNGTGRYFSLTARYAFK